MWTTKMKIVYERDAELISETFNSIRRGFNRVRWLVKRGFGSKVYFIH